MTEKITIDGQGADTLIADAVARGDAARAEARRQARLRPQGPVHRYQPHGTCVELFKYRGDEVLFAGPAGTGKSRACLEKLHAMALANAGFRGLIVRKTLASLGSTALVTFESHVATQHLANNEMKWFGGSPKEAACYRYKNGSTITVGGMDKSMKIMSSEYDCVVGETLVDSPSGVQKGYGRPYSGKLVTITTAGGKQLTGTPNHPVLTDKGWVALGLLGEGDYVVRYRRDEEEAVGGADPDVADQPAPIAEVVRALTLSESSRSERVETVPVDFHGDGAYGYVDVVTAGGLLHDGGGSSGVQHVPQVEGDWGDLEQGFLVGDASGVEGDRRVLLARLAFARASELPHALSIGVGAPPVLDGAFPGRREVPLPDGIDPHALLSVGERVGGGAPGDASAGHFPLESGDADTQGGGGLGEALDWAGEVSLDRVVEVTVADAGRGRHVYNLQTGGHWYVANGIVSHNCVYVQEATELTENDWEAITTRLRNGKVSFQQLMADANPDVPTHWLKVRCDKGKTKMIRSRHEDNPTLFDPKTGEITEGGRAYMNKLDALTGVRYMRLRKGIWCAAEGLVYEEWDPEIHLHKRIVIPPISWTRYISVDFGYTNPMVVQFWAEDEDGRLYLYKELYATKTTVDEMAPKIKEAMNLRREPRPRAIICDHDAEGRAVLERELGMHTVQAKKSVEDGIQAVKKRMKVSDADGKPRIYLCAEAIVSRDKLLEDVKKPTCTLDEVVGYIWDRGTAIAQQNGKPPKEHPVKGDDHGMDAMRYMIAHRDLKGRPRVRTITY